MTTSPSEAQSLRDAVAAPSCEEVRRLLTYYPETGEFVWNVSPAQRVKSGHKAGGNNGKQGHIKIKIAGKKYFAHRLAWLYMTGEWPVALIDHIDRNPSNNKFSNLRPATQSENIRNRGVQSNNKVGLKGVRLSYGKYVAQIKVGKECFFLGTFDSAEKASEAYAVAAATYHGEFGGAK